MFDDRPYALVADDDSLIRIHVEGILEDAGFRSLLAATPEEALIHLKERAGDVILLFTDVYMPPSEQDGFYLARECAKRWPDIGILVASGQADPAEGDMPDGATFVRKPFSADVVYDRLQELLPDGQKPDPLKSRQK